jgi:hypothetical protein
MKKLLIRKALMRTDSTSAVPTMTVKSITKLRKAFLRAFRYVLRKRAIADRFLGRMGSITKLKYVMRRELTLVRFSKPSLLHDA